MMTPTKSSVVLVAGSALKDLQKVMNKLGSMAEDMKKIPYVVILIVRENEMVPGTVRHAMSPPVVSLKKLLLTCISKYNFCRCRLTLTSMAPFPPNFSLPATVW